MGGNKNKAKRKKKRQREKQNNATEVGAQARIEPTRDSLETHATSTRENTADCEDVAVSIQVSGEEQTSASHAIQPSGDLEIDKSLAAGSFPTYDTPTTPITAPYPILQPENMRLCLSIRDGGIVIQAMDNNLQGLEIKVLAESIYSRREAVSVTKEIIRNHAREEARKRVSNDLDTLIKFSGGMNMLHSDDSDKEILLNIFRKAFARFIRLTECKGLDSDVVTKLRTEPGNESHGFSEKDEKKIFSFLHSSTVVKGHVTRAWIEEILDKAELTIDQLTYLLGQGREIYVNSHSEVVKKYWNLNGVVRSMLEIRNSVVHRKFQFIRDQEKRFFKLYRQFILTIHLRTYFPKLNPKLELDRYLQLEATSKDFENIVKGWNEMVELCGASEDERRKLKKEIGRLKNLVETYEEANYLQEIFSLRKQVADLVEENTQLKRENMEIKRKYTCSKDAVPANIPFK